MDYRQLYDLESYVCDTVGPRFRTVGKLSAFDFFCIVVWKANRAKSKIAKRLLVLGHGDLERAVGVLTSDLTAAVGPKERLRVLHRKWGFRLPMSSAILSVLYPEEFTVYDVRVCGVLGDFSRLGSITRFDRLWDGYVEYRKAVSEAVPGHLSLRDKDRFLWGKSFAEQLQHQVGSGFAKAAPDVR